MPGSSSIGSGQWAKSTSSYLRLLDASAISITHLAICVQRRPARMLPITTSTKLVALGLVKRWPGKADQRSREASITAEGRRLVRAIIRARRRLFHKLLAGWSPADLQALARLNRRLADAMRTAQYS